jgi:tetratricopeptide (TPR) repeat protein
MAELNQAIAMAPNEPDVHRALGELLAGMRRDNEALAEFKKVLEIRPEDTEARVDRATLYLNRRQTREAEADFLKVLTHRPDHFRALKTLGEIRLFQQHDLKGAKTYFQRALDQNPNNADVQYKLAMTCDMAGDVPNAIRHYVLAMRLGLNPSMRRDASERLEMLNKQASAPLRLK